MNSNRGVGHAKISIDRDGAMKVEPLELGDYEHSCGCARRTHRDETGRIEYVDEVRCRGHLAPVWEGLKDERNG